MALQSSRVKGTVALLRSAGLPEELAAASCSKCSSTCSCRETPSLQTQEHRGQSRLLCPRTHTGQRGVCGEPGGHGWPERRQVGHVDVGLAASGRTAQVQAEALLQGL